MDDGQLPGFLVTVARHGQLVHVGRYGHRDVENGLPVTDDTRWRIYSMTKPVTSVAAMMLYEEGAFELNDPITKWLPEFAETPRVRRRARPRSRSPPRRWSRSGCGTCSPTRRG